MRPKLLSVRCICELKKVNLSAKLLGKVDSSEIGNVMYDKLVNIKEAKVDICLCALTKWALKRKSKLECEIRKKWIFDR